MNSLQFFTNLQLGWFNAWIPAFAMVLIQFVYMSLHKESGKRAVDTSWYTAKDKLNGAISSLFQIALLVLSLFVPFKTGTAWFWVGATLYVLASIAFIWSFHSYGAADLNATIQGGIYRWSRNPMYFFYFVGTLGICIATASLWMLLLLIPFGISMHLTVLGEERYCEQTYGKSYLAYKQKTPRYLLF